MLRNPVPLVFNQQGYCLNVGRSSYRDLAIFTGCIHGIGKQVCQNLL